jgi:hypothetical protein
MTAPISHATEEALREAMARLLAGRPVKTDGHLTVVNLAIEAGVSRATANRAAGLLADFRRAVAGLRARDPSADSVRSGAEEESRNAHILAQHIQARALHAKLQERRAASADILPFRRKAHAHNDGNEKGGETPWTV